MIRSAAVFLCGFTLAGCATVEVDQKVRHVRGFDYTASREGEVASGNPRLVEASYRHEWRFNHNPNRPPRLCLAMSGGGMRSAAFNIGVLKGLHQAGILGQVDVMSSVSGGGYALSWYYLQQASTHATPDELFDENGRFQKYLSNHSSLAYEDPDSPWRWTSYVVAFGKWLPSWPAHFVSNIVFDWRANLNPLRRTYENGIERVFHLSPASTDVAKDGFVNKAAFWSSSTVDQDKEVTFPGLRHFIEERRLPFFVINTTVAIDDDPEHYGAEFNKVIYEFTPLQHGADAFGKHFSEFPFGVSRAVSISGAAKDSATTPGAARQLFDLTTNTDLGYYISNPHPEAGKSFRSWKRALPLPFYLAIPNYRDKVGTDIYLTDGGHSDNLATYSLVRRMCGEIIVVDAEHDPGFEFGGLKRLKKRLFAEMGVGFDIPETLDPAHPVRTGMIGSFPVQYPNELINRKIAVHYIKLSIDESRLNQYSPAVREYYERHGRNGDRDNRFPQQSTSDLNYNTGQFLAYRDLGADIVRLYLVPEMNKAPTNRAARGSQ